MPKFVMLSTLGPDGYARLRDSPERLREVNADVLECTPIDPEAEAAARAQGEADPDFMDPFDADDLA